MHQGRLPPIESKMSATLSLIPERERQTEIGIYI